MKPRKMGVTPTPRTTDEFGDADADIVAAGKARRTAERDDAWHAGRVVGLRRDTADRSARRFRERRQPLDGRHHLLVFAGIRRPDVDEGRELAVRDPVEAGSFVLHGGRQRPGLARHRVVCVSARGPVSVTGATRVGHGLALDRTSVAARGGAQRLFLEVRLLHQPMRQPAQEVDLRPAALEAARPQPGMVGQQQRDAALALPREDEQRLVGAPDIITDAARRVASRSGGTIRSMPAASDPSPADRASPDGGLPSR